MSYHQVSLRKDGPTHAIQFQSKDRGYVNRTACGMWVNQLDPIRARIFPPSDTPACKRCVASVSRPQE